MTDFRALWRRAFAEQLRPLLVAPRNGHATGPASQNGNHAAVMDMAGAVRREKAAKAEMAELGLARRRGELISRAEVEAEAFRAGRDLRNALMTLPERLAGPLVSKDEFQIHQALRDELIEILSRPMRVTGHSGIDVATGERVAI